MQLLRPLTDASFATQSVAYSGTAGSTSGWNAGPQGVLVWSTTDMYVRVGENVTATTADTPIPAYTPVPITVPPSVSGLWRVSALQIGSAGTLYAKPMNIQ